MKMYRVMTGKYKCHMACNSYKIHNVERMFWGDTEVYVLQKNDFWSISMKFLPMGEGTSSGMPYHFTQYQ